MRKKGNEKKEVDRKKKKQSEWQLKEKIWFLEPKCENEGLGFGLSKLVRNEIETWVQIQIEKAFKTWKMTWT